GALSIPGLHRGVQFGCSFLRRRQWAGERAHCVVASRGFGVAVLRFLEVIKGKEKRQQTRIGRSLEAKQVGRMDDEHAMQRESRRTTIDVANACEEERSHELPVGYAAPQLLDGHCGALLPWRAFDQSDEGLDFGTEAKEVRRNLRLCTGKQK